MLGPHAAPPAKKGGAVVVNRIVLAIPLPVTSTLFGRWHFTVAKR